MNFKDDAEHDLNHISSKFKDFTHSGQQNIMRMVFTVLLSLGAALITTYANYRDISIFHLIRCMLWNLKIWIPIVVAVVVYGGLTIAMKMNPGNVVERYTGLKDENGVQLAANGTYGTAAWMSKREAYDKLEVENIKRCNGVILGGFDAEGKEVVCIPRGKKQAREITNQNVCIFGSPGEGKSWGYARCNMLQAIRRGESVIVTDPKGELYKDMNKLYRENGYTVKLFNLANPQKSDAWNCMNVCFNKTTGNVDLNRVKIFVEAIMKNTSDPDDTHDYFANNEKTLYEAVIMYMAEKYVSDIREKLNKMVVACNTQDNKQTYYNFRLKFVRQDSYLNDIKKEAKQIFVTYGPGEQMIRDITFARAKAAQAEGKEVDSTPIVPAVSPEDRAKQFDEFFEILTLDLVKPTLSNVYHKINRLDLDAFKNEVDAMNNPTALCHIPLSTILQQSPQVWPNFINGCSVRLNVLNDEILRLMVSEDDIDLSAPGREKCAYFCIVPDQDFTFQFVSSLFFTFLFKDQIETADANSGNPVAINYILDEFANIGMIPDFSNKISTARSRNIGITMIVQTITQLFQIYSENITNTILGCCSTLICLGVNDDATVKYFVNKLGETTIVARSTRDERKMGRLDRFLPEYTESLGEGRRSLLTFDEMRRINATDLVVVCAHLKPLLLKKITANFHPLSNGGHFDTSSLDDISPFVERYVGCERRDEFAKEQYERVLKEIQEYERKKILAANKNAENTEYDESSADASPAFNQEAFKPAEKTDFMPPSRGFERDEYPDPSFTENAQEPPLNKPCEPFNGHEKEPEANQIDSDFEERTAKEKPNRSANDVMGILSSTQQADSGFKAVRQEPAKAAKTEASSGRFTGKAIIAGSRAKASEGSDPAVGRVCIASATANYGKAKAGPTHEPVLPQSAVEPEKKQMDMPEHEEQEVVNSAIQEREEEKKEESSEIIQFICTPAPEKPNPEKETGYRDEPITFTLADGENQF